MTVGRPPNILRPCKLGIYLPEDVKAKLDLHLFSAVEGRVPHGAYSRFIAERVREFFDPMSAINQHPLLLKRITETVTDGWDSSQVEAIETFREHILRR